MTNPTQKQLAYLRHLGVLDAPDTKERAGEWIDRIHDGTGFTPEQNADLQRQMSSWARERISKHPDLYPPDPSHDEEFFSRVDLPFQDEIRGAIRRMVVGSSGRLTSEKINAVGLLLWRIDQDWQRRSDWKDVIINELKIRNPECFDGRVPEAKARKPSGKSSEANGKGCLVILAACVLPIVGGVFWFIG